MHRLMAADTMVRNIFVYQTIWKGNVNMVLGIPDFWIWSAYLLSVLSAIACVVYGVMNWNKGAETEAEQVTEEVVWEAEEKKVEDKL